MTARKAKLRWFQFSLWTLLVFVTLCAFPYSWLAVKLHQAKRQRETVAEIVKLGGRVTYDWQFDEERNYLPGAQMRTPKWLRSLLGDDLFQSVSEAILSSTQITDAGVKKLQQALPNCKISRIPFR
jgi:hypothetical protein